MTLDKGTDDLPKTELYTLVNTVFLSLRNVLSMHSLTENILKCLLSVSV